MCLEHPVLHGSNLEIVDRGILDRVPAVLETRNSKHDISNTYSTYIMCVRNILKLVLFC